MKESSVMLAYVKGIKAAVERGDLLAADTAIAFFLCIDGHTTAFEPISYSLRQLCAATGIKDVKTVRAALARLEAAGLIRQDERIGCPNLLSITIPPLPMSGTPTNERHPYQSAVALRIPRTPTNKRTSNAKFASADNLDQLIIKDPLESDSKMNAEEKAVPVASKKKSKPAQEKKSAYKPTDKEALELAAHFQAARAAWCALNAPTAYDAKPPSGDKMKAAGKRILRAMAKTKDARPPLEHAKAWIDWLFSDHAANGRFSWGSVCKSFLRLPNKLETAHGQYAEWMRKKGKGNAAIGNQSIASGASNDIAAYRKADL